MKSAISDVVLIKSSNGRWWQETLVRLVPGIQCVVYGEDAYDPRSITYVIAWDPPLGFFSELTSLKATLSIGAGVSHITKDSGYPRSVPIVRTVGAPLRSRMAEYVSLHVLRVHRRLDEVIEASRGARWQQYLAPPAVDVRVGVMGLGNLGGAAATALCGLGFSVRGWSRRGREFQGVDVYQESELEAFLTGLQFLVCLLPQTSKTENILDRHAFSFLAAGAHLISAGRGEHLVEADLLDALDSGQLGSATLDVFQHEPLDPSSSLWKHPRLLITCHTAAAIDPGVGGEIVGANLRTLLNGQMPIDVVDLEQGY